MSTMTPSSAQADAPHAGSFRPIADYGLLASALASPRNLYLYDQSAGLFDLATAYAFHIAKNHAFYDGNKRTGLQAAVAFLKVNGYIVETSPVNAFNWMVSLTTGELSKAAFSEKLCSCSVRERGLTILLRRLLPVG